MGRRLSTQTRRELLAALRNRYCHSSKKEKVQILDEFVEVSGYHRKHAVRLLTNTGRELVAEGSGANIGKGKRIYDEAVKEALTVLWEASDRICGKRLKAILPDLVDAMERHGHLELDGEVKRRLLTASAATLDRLLAPVCSKARPRRKRRSSGKVRMSIPVRTFMDWGDPDPGYFEIDFVVHYGGCMADSFIHTLVATDICSGWTECVPLLAREQSLVVEGLDVLFGRGELPVHSGSLLSPAFPGNTPSHSCTPDLN